MKCNKCKGEWNPPPGRSITLCPFCNENLKNSQSGADDMSPENVLKTIVKQFGEETLLDTRKLTGLLSDYLNKDKQMKRLLSRAAEDGVPKNLHGLKSVDERDREYKIREIAARFTRDNFIVEEAAYKAVNYYADALGYNQVTVSVAQPLPEKILTKKEAEKLTAAYVNIPHGYTKIDAEAFSENEKIKIVDIPDGVTSIGDSAFAGCSNLKRITIPDGVTSIGDWVFFFCTSLEEITIPDGVTSIGEYAFESETIILCSRNSYADKYCRANNKNPPAKPGVFHITGEAL